jgi:hypothetical protein
VRWLARDCRQLRHWRKRLSSRQENTMRSRFVITHDDTASPAGAPSAGQAGLQWLPVAVEYLILSFVIDGLLWPIIFKFFYH